MLRTFSMAIAADTLSAELHALHVAVNIFINENELIIFIAITRQSVVHRGDIGLP